MWYMYSVSVLNVTLATNTSHLHFAHFMTLTQCWVLLQFSAFANVGSVAYAAHSLDVRTQLKVRITVLLLVVMRLHIC